MSKLYNELVRQQREAQIQDSELGDIPVMMTVPELGKLLRISRNKAYEYVRIGAVPSIKVGKQIRIFRGDVLALRRLRHSSEDR
jgi:excisionase family DNA binding protein